jgi:phosphohistidine phosphatase
MLRLLLLRHAKSDWNNAELSDHARPLNERGKQAAPKIGEYIASHDLEPELILSSSATRVQQTRALVIDKFETDPEVRVLDELYSFSGFQNVLNIIRNQGEKQSPLMMIGHNPTIQDLAMELIGAGNSSARARLNEKYPTAGLAVIDFDIRRWAELQTRIGIIVHFIRPRDL